MRPTSKDQERAMVIAHKRGLESARARTERTDMLAHAAIFPTMEERDSFLAGYYAEVRRISQRTKINPPTK